MAFTLFSSHPCVKLADKTVAAKKGYVNILRLAFPSTMFVYVCIKIQIHISAGAHWNENKNLDYE